MKKIKAAYRYNPELLKDYPDYKNKIIKDLSILVAQQMYKDKCYGIFEVNSESEPPYQNELFVETYAMCPIDMFELTRLLKNIKSGLSPDNKYLVDKLEKLIID